MNVTDARTYFAEELRVTCGLTSARLVEAIASVPRERFLPPGPWQLRGPYDQGPRLSDDADPRHVCHDVAVAIHAERNLYNGQPSLIAGWIEALKIDAGHRIVHIGCGTGYFTAWIASIVGQGGQVFAFDVDESLASRAAANLADMPWVEVRTGDGVHGLPRDVDAVLVHAGATHVLDEWLDAVKDGGRLLVPMTFAAPGMPGGIGKGIVLHLHRQGDTWHARFGLALAIYSLIGARNEEMQAMLGKALMAGTFARVMRLRRDPHEQTAGCWLHGPSNCLAIAE